MMKTRNKWIICTLCIVVVAVLLPLTSEAQDNVIRRTTTTTTSTTRSTTTTTTSKPQDRVVRKPTPKPTTGTLTLSSTPSEASVKIDGEYMGTTPLTLKNRKPGTYSVTFSAEGYESQTSTVTVSVGKTATCSATLKRKVVSPPEPTTGSLELSSTPSEAAVKIDGEFLGTTPLTLKNRKPGTYSVTFSAEGYESQTRSVSVTAGKTATCSVTLNKKQVSQPVQQQATTTSSGSSQTITANGVSFKMIRVDGGTFMMGATSEQGRHADAVEKPAHRVTLSTYYIGETEVTQALWQAVMGSNPSYFKGDNRPVEQVSWDDCKSFISKLSSMTGKSFRLPTEAEWEFAARGGTKSQGYKYSGSNNIGSVAWFTDNSGQETHPVKTKAPNELGIYDMSGNVREWCADWYGENYYSSSPQSNPSGPSSGSFRVCPGGGWNVDASYCRVSFRGRNSPGRQFSSLGLRLVL